MRFTFTSGGSEQTVEFSQSEILIGRSEGDHRPDLDLDPDKSVSRRHARVWEQDGQFWIEDLNSTTGTLLNGQAISAISPLRSSDNLQVGATTIVFANGDGDDQKNVMIDDESADTPSKPGLPTTAPASLSEEESDIRISETLTATERPQLPFQEADTAMRNRLTMLYELPLQFAEENNLSELFHLILRKVVELIPGARRGALLVIDPVFNKLALRASIPEDDPPISRTLVKRAVSKASGFIWLREEETDLTQSIRSLDMHAGMYAPLMWKGEIQGVVCVDSPHSSSGFSDKDLKFLMSVAHYAAAAVANHQLQNDLTEKNTVMERLLTNFSPRLRSKLVDKARHDRLQPGGEKSDVTLLMSDIRGFTKMTTGMDSAIVVEMLNEYFSVLVEVIFEYQGTVDKFIGDAILAVFGSPEPDDHQQQNAVRAALAMQDAMKRVNTARNKRGAVTCKLGIGLHHGEVLHGFIGSENRLEFTVIGETVNRTARFCDGAKAGETLVSDELNAHIKDNFVTERTSIPTKHEGAFSAHRVTGKKG